MHKTSWSIGAVWLIGAVIARSAEAQTYYPLRESQGGWRSLVAANATPTSAQKSTIQSTTELNWDRLLDSWNYMESVARGNSLLVIRNGWIAGEWDSGYDGALNSGSKSLGGLALALLTQMSDAGQLHQTFNLDDYAYKYLPSTWGNSDSRKKLIKVKHLLNMCSGLHGWEGDPAAPPTSTLSDCLALTVEDPPETIYKYSSASQVLAGMCLE